MMDLVAIGMWPPMVWMGRCGARRDDRAASRRLRIPGNSFAETHRERASSASSFVRTLVATPAENRRDHPCAKTFRKFHDAQGWIRIRHLQRVTAVAYAPTPPRPDYRAPYAHFADSTGGDHRGVPKCSMVSWLITTCAAACQASTCLYRNPMKLWNGAHYVE